ncbi:uncharacterized protein LOC108040234 [Drosophila rhopaloa]|uniref:Uncharacterized protein LOC108040234 n=1 Tax=Drosophila rhopaloa TaxID=1041015 RepID=A0A6P4E587_DRORH|nr:uncharacterized protein LOC108040234 [Drosophila rhopaloa]XP_016973083.1 uncharacterized protein LOC108040234 [Drosophila rhopaloa]XP_016973084.1 uncharacterized protein LOC108040234 [Drosophila rhopaloa]
MTTTSTCKRISSETATNEIITAISTTKPSSHSSQGTSVICEEVFDDACFPSSEEINEYASLIGIEPHREQHLLYLAKEGLMAALPLDWKICYSEEKNGHYYHNTRTKESQWDHPLDAIYRDLVNQARLKVWDSAAVSENMQFVDNSDDLSQLDSGIRSMQGFDEIPSPGPLPLNTLTRKWSIANKTSFLGPSVLSAGKSRFLDSGSKEFGRFYQLGCDETRTKLQIASKQPQTNTQLNGKPENSEEKDKSLAEQRKGVGKVSSTISMFQKAHRQFEGDGYTSPSGVKGILRDSSITDINRRLDRLEPTLEVEDKKSVRFNLDQGEIMKKSPEDTLSTKKTQTCKHQENSEDDDEDVQVVIEDNLDGKEEAVDQVEDDYLLWNEKGGVYNLNPFLLDSNKSITVSGGQQSPPEEPTDKTNECEAPKLFYDDTDSDSKGSSVRSFIINKSEQDSSLLAGNNAFDLEELGRKHSYELEQLQLKSAQAAPEKSISGNSDSKFSEAQLQQDFEAIRRDHEAKLKRFRHEYDLRLTSHQHKLEEAFELQIEKYRVQLERQLQNKRSLVVSEHKNRIDSLQSNHDEILRELERELHNEEEIIRREQAARLAQLRDKFARELDLEKQRFREKGEERLYEKVRCEKRLLEDKYRCLKEKYVRLKTDVKLSLERRNRRREAQLVPQHTHTNNSTKSNTEMERSIYYKPPTHSGNSDNRSLSFSDQAIAGEAVVKPPVPHKGQLSKSYNSSCIRQLQLQDDNTSISQSDTTLSNTYNNGRYGKFLKSASGALSARSDNGNLSREPLGGAVALQSGSLEKNNNSNQVKETGTGIGRIVFSRTKSASTSRLNSDTGYKGERPCTPVENLRHQLQKLEALEDQFPENTLDAPYHLRYPFTDISIKPNGVGSELEFFKHRIHLERDSVRRAKESLRTQRTNFRLRQREIGQQRKTSALSPPKHSIDQLIQEEKELTEMEVNLHRTRSLLGEKIIRLRHLEQSLLRIYEKEKSILDLGAMDDAATLSDLSSHSSSGFSSTELASAADFHKKKEYYQQESNECIENLEILNAEIREILDIFGQKQHEQSATAIPILSPRDLGWSHVLKHQHSAGGQLQTSSSTPTHFSLADDIEGVGVGGSGSGGAVHMPHSIPTLADRLETYRQLAAGRMQSSMGAAILTANTIVSQSPRAVNYTTCLVERTRDLRNWLRQAKNEHDFLVGMGVQHGLSGPTSVAGLGEAGAGSVTGICASSASASTINSTSTATGGSCARGKNDI